MAPILRVPTDARNTHLLDRLLDGLVDESAAGGHRTAAVNKTESDDLGRVLHERRKHLGQLAVELIASAVVVLLLSTQLAGNRIPPVGVAVIGFLAIAFSWYFITAAGTVIRCHEYGIMWTFFGRERMLRYSEIEETDFDDTRMYVWVHDEHRPIASVAVSEPNFYPGWVLYYRLQNVHHVISDEEAEAMEVASRGDHYQ
jgi:hypothetical protein